MRGFTKVPNSVLLDTRLTIGARVVYGVVAHLAWRAGRRDSTDLVELPSLQTIAAGHVGCSKTAMQGYVSELRHAGLVVNQRVKNQGMVYAIFDAPASSPAEVEERRARVKSGIELGRIPTQLEGSRPSISYEDPSQEVEAIASTVPAVTLVDGQNLPMNALAEECKVSLKGGRVPRLAVALAGQRGRPGIRAFFWRELVEWAHANGRMDELREAAGARFEHALAAAIRTRSQLYREKMPDHTMLTPTALSTYWTDLNTMPSAGRRRTTGDDIRRRAGI